MNIIEIIVEEDYDKRIDIYLTEHMDKISRSTIQKLIKDKLVKVNGKATKPRYLVKKGDNIVVEIIKNDEDIKAENIPIDVVYEDEDIAIINKPQGMVVHPAPGNNTGTLVNALLYHFKRLGNMESENRPGIVHRIDKDTSGLLIIAKSDLAYESLVQELKEHKVVRKYYALVEGIIKEESGTINAPIGRHPVDRKKMAVVEKNSKDAITHFKVLERFEQHTLIEAKLETGRTHQIRVHMAFINNPVVGDPVYGYRNQKFKLNGQLLHAKTLGLTHPRTKEYIEFDSEIPNYFINVLNKLKN